MKSEILSRRERENLLRRQEILSAASELFSERGYHFTTMRQIAEKAEFSIVTIYKLFHSKEGLYKTLLLEQCDKLEEAIMHAIEEADNEVSQLRNYIRFRGESLGENRALFHLYFAESIEAGFNSESSLFEEVRIRRNSFVKKLASVLESAVRKKRLKRIADPYRLAAALDGALNAFLFLWMDVPEHQPYLEASNAFGEVLINGLAMRDFVSEQVTQHDHQLSLGGL